MENYIAHINRLYEMWVFGSEAMDDVYRGNSNVEFIYLLEFSTVHMRTQKRTSTVARYEKMMMYLHLHILFHSILF